MSFSTPSVPMTVTNAGYIKGTSVYERYKIYEINVSIISWNLDGTCTVEISIDAEKTYDPPKYGHYIDDEINIEITDSNGETVNKAISVSKKSITIEVDASLSYCLTIDESFLYL